MTKLELREEMQMWQDVVDLPKQPGNPSNAARAAAQQQLALAEAWYHRKDES
jgi:hypothetical protein